MKQSIIAITILLAALFIVACNDSSEQPPTSSAAYTPSEDIVRFADSDLDSVIRRLIGKPTGDIIRPSDLDNITTLVLRDVSDITGLEHCVNLTNLDLNEWSEPVFRYDEEGNTRGVDTAVPLNHVSDIYPLVANTGLGEGDIVDLRSNPLSEVSKNVYVPQLEERGVTVYITKPSTPLPESELTHIVFCKSWLSENDESEIPLRIKVTFPVSWLSESPHSGNCDVEVILRVPNSLLKLSDTNDDPDLITFDGQISLFQGYSE